MGGMGEVGGKLEREEILIYIRLINIVVQQKLEHYKVIILQLNTFYKF